MVHKENHSADSVEFIDYVDYADCRSDESDVKQDGPTVHSITAALAAQKRERAAFTRDTGARLNRDGRIRHSPRSLES